MRSRSIQWPWPAPARRAAQPLCQPAGVGGQLLDGLRDQSREVVAKPGMGLELEGVGRLMQRDEGAELVERQAKVRPRWP